jgi:dethiobiotin synthetase
VGVIFVTGSGTDVGKTYVSASLVRARRAAGRPVLALKPVASGLSALDAPDFADSDTARLLSAQGLAVTPETVAACSPWRFAAPLAPDMAARAEGRSLLLAEIVDWCRRRIAEAPVGTDILVEGVGGLMSPVAEDGTGLDWLLALGCPALLVCGSYLGAISHALTAVEALRARRAPLAGLVLNESPAPAVDLGATADALRRFAGLDPVIVRRGAAVPATAWAN